MQNELTRDELEQITGGIMVKGDDQFIVTGKALMGFEGRKSERPGESDGRRGQGAAQR